MIRHLKTAALFLALGLALALPLLFAQDSTATTPATAGAQVQYGVLSGLGFLSVFLTGWGKKLADWIDSKLDTANSIVLNLYKAFQPVVALGFTLLLPKLEGFLGHPLGIAGDTLAAAPASTLIFISLRELWDRYSPLSAKNRLVT